MRRGLEGKRMENREQKDFSLTIVVHRHGPKESMSGPLSPEGIEQAEDYFCDAYEGVAFDSLSEGVDVVTSPIHRAKRTGQIHVATIRRAGGEIKSVQEDERLSEGQIAHHPDLIEKYGGRGGKWLPGWVKARKRPLPEVKTGREAAKQFAEWLWEKIEMRKKQGGSQEIDAFSHGPAMAAFLLILEKKLNTKILAEPGREVDTFERIIRYLEYFNLQVDSTHPQEALLTFQDKRVAIPLKILKNMANK